MIFDAHLKTEGVLFRCAKEDYETEPWYSCCGSSRSRRTAP